MPADSRKGTPFLVAVLLLLAAGTASAQLEVTELRFNRPPASLSDTLRSLQSLTKVQGTGQFCEDGLYLMTHFGDREDLFQKANQEAMDHPLANQTWRHCSLFSTTGGGSVLMGRNWDNQNVGSVIASLYEPPEGYASISFTRSIDMGFGHKDLEHHKSSEFGRMLLMAPFHAYDGINERGLAVGVAGVAPVAVKPRAGKERIYVPFLVRKILDQTQNTGEAAALVEGYVPFDIDASSLNTHFFVVDASGKSVVLEYVHDKWKRTYGSDAWQVLTNRDVHAVPDADLRAKCWRYRGIAEALENSDGRVGWEGCLGLLRGTSQKGTTWSVVYSLTSRELHFSVYQDWDTVYHLAAP
jgi:hypothetical protein